MSVWNRLVESYKLIADLPEANELREPQNFLLRDGLCTNKCDLEIILDLDGNLIGMSIIPKEDRTTIIPCTWKSVQRTAGDDPHPLFDKLQYMASDWDYILPESRELDDCRKKNVKYLELLGKWAEFTQQSSIKAVYKFVVNNHIVREILDRFSVEELGISTTDNSVINTESTQSDTKAVVVNQNDNGIQNNKEIFNKIKDLFARFKVIQPNKLSELWLDNDVYGEWSNNYKQIYVENGSDLGKVMSYISGELEDSNMFFPKKIRHQGDGARLMSANDETKVTFGDRFEPKNYNQVAPIGNESMQQSLYALSWLINRQAFNLDGFTVLTWNNYTPEVNEPNIYATRNNFFIDDFDIDKKDFSVDSNKVVTALMRYGQRGKMLDKFAEGHKVSVLVLDGESKGRIAIQYYNEFDSEIYYQMLARWFQSCKWLYYEWREHLGEDGKVRKVRDLPMEKTPLFDNIFGIIYKDCGAKSGESATKLKKKFYRDILQCVLNGRVTRVMARKAFLVVCNSMGFSDSEKYSANYTIWQNAIATACAMYNSYKSDDKLGEKYMKLNLQETDRSYCFGRLLAILEKIEKTEVKDRATNAERMFNHYAKTPCTTFGILLGKCRIYLDKMAGNGKMGLSKYFDKQIADILGLMEDNGFDDRSLSEMFLLGYYGQKYYKNPSANEDEAVAEDEE